jgi:hypothetical protein
MKSVFTGLIAAALLAAAAAFFLDTRVQQPAETRFSTEGVRL